MEFRLDQTIEVLERTPGTLRSLLGDLSEPWVTCNEGTDTWTASDDPPANLAQGQSHLAVDQKGAVARRYRTLVIARMEEFLYRRGGAGGAFGSLCRAVGSVRPMDWEDCGQRIAGKERDAHLKGLLQIVRQLGQHAQAAADVKSAHHHGDSRRAE